MAAHARMSWGHINVSVLMNIQDLTAKLVSGMSRNLLPGSLHRKTDWSYCVILWFSVTRAVYGPPYWTKNIHFLLTANTLWRGVRRWLTNYILYQELQIGLEKDSILWGNTSTRCEFKLNFTFIVRDSKSIFEFHFISGKNFQALGCFSDTVNDRAMDKLLFNFRGQIDWRDMSKTVKNCSEAARKQPWVSLSTVFARMADA